ncbi:putative Zn finger-like uncharacterized protein [Aliiruegeria haliotis]|uniref:Putative Zn finger-like uncharacterized protein n=1 Tax=Aliiruegeria haliotis TaxID=1280846 RepID=A0A2T0RL24_9RHOB|nr:zinc-ribbon domain-containing protein [Aliiruegeria haliotis]PRY21895.1 putative Zn finger-like uncharacterized protein [Aliiruegeria haliotis]
MRLICPNCGAQYQVDERVIPEAGRDVQCSNCGNTWFQTHPDFDEALAEELGQPGRASAARAPKPEPERDRVAEPSPPPAPEAAEPEVAEVPESVHRSAASTAAPEHDPEPAPAPQPEDDLSAVGVAPRRRVDEGVLSVLREEAERERAARHAEAEQMEIQPEPDALGAEQQGASFEAAIPVAPTGRHPAKVMPSDTYATDFDQKAASRRDRLPDVEEINSTLDPMSGAAGANAIAEVLAFEREQRKRGSRFGMGFAFFAFGLLTVLYVKAGTIGDAVPETSATLQAYVGSVDAGRLWLDETLRGAVGAVNGEN